MSETRQLQDVRRIDDQPSSMQFMQGVEIDLSRRTLAVALGGGSLVLLVYNLLCGHGES